MDTQHTQHTKSRFATNGDALSPWETGHRAQEEDPSLGELLKRLSNDTGDLLSQEVALAKAELRESASNVGKGAVKIGIALLFGLTGALALTAFLIIGLGGATGGHYATWALVVGAVEVIIAAVAANGARKAMKPSEIKPVETIETLRENKSWAKDEMRDLKHDLTSTPASSHQNREG
jgi:uncharacterized membrane protein YqjE